MFPNVDGTNYSNVDHVSRISISMKRDGLRQNPSKRIATLILDCEKGLCGREEKGILGLALVCCAYFHFSPRHLLG